MLDRRGLVGALGALAAIGGASGAKASASPRTPMWKATRGAQVVWLFGGPHSTPAVPPWRTADFDRVFAKAGGVFVETLHKRGLRRSFEALRIMMSPRGRRTRDLLPPRELAEFERLAKRYDLDKSVFWDLKPRFAGRYIVSGYLAEHLGDKGINSPMAAMLNLRRGRPGRLLELEDIMVATRVEAQVDGERQLAYLIQVLNNLPKYAENSAARYKAWIAGDIDRLREIVEFEAADLRNLGIETEIMGGRQDRWVNTITEAAQTGEEVAVLVGLSHIVARTGMLPAFEARGFKVGLV